MYVDIEYDRLFTWQGQAVTLLVVAVTLGTFAQKDFDCGKECANAAPFLLLFTLRLLDEAHVHRVFRTTTATFAWGMWLLYGTLFSEPQYEAKYHIKYLVDFGSVVFSLISMRREVVEQELFRISSSLVLILLLLYPHDEKISVSQPWFVVFMRTLAFFILFAVQEFYRIRRALEQERLGEFKKDRLEQPISFAGLDDKILQIMWVLFCSRPWIAAVVVQLLLLRQSARNDVKKISQERQKVSRDDLEMGGDDDIESNCEKSHKGRTRSRFAKNKKKKKKKAPSPSPSPSSASPSPSPSPSPPMTPATFTNLENAFIPITRIQPAAPPPPPSPSPPPPSPPPPPPRELTREEVERKLIEEMCREKNEMV